MPNTLASKLELGKKASFDRKEIAHPTKRMVASHTEVMISCRKALNNRENQIYITVNVDGRKKRKTYLDINKLLGED